MQHAKSLEASTTLRQDPKKIHEHLAYNPWDILTSMSAQNVPKRTMNGGTTTSIRRLHVVGMTVMTMTYKSTSSTRQCCQPQTCKKNNLMTINNFILITHKSSYMTYIVTGLINRTSERGSDGVWAQSKAQQPLSTVQ